MVQLTLSPTQLDDQVLLRVADGCANLQRLVFVDDRYSEYICRQAADAKKVSTVCLTEYNLSME